jgi:hypothetical protein
MEALSTVINSTNVTEWWKYRPGTAGPIIAGMYNCDASPSGWLIDTPLYVQYVGGGATVQPQLVPDYYR